jgi:hypothetical protein
VDDKKQNMTIYCKIASEIQEKTSNAYKIIVIERII